MPSEHSLGGPPAPRAGSPRPATVTPPVAGRGGLAPPETVPTHRGPTPTAGSRPSGGGGPSPGQQPPVAPALGELRRAQEASRPSPTSRSPASWLDGAGPWFGEWPGKRNGGNTDTAPRPTQRRTRSCCAWMGSPRSRRWTAPMLPMQPRAARTALPRQRAARPPHSFDRSGVQGLQVGRHRVRGTGPASCRAATDQPQRLCGATTFHVARRTVSERVASSTSPSGTSSPAADPCA